MREVGVHPLLDEPQLRPRSRRSMLYTGLSLTVLAALLLAGVIDLLAPGSAAPAPSAAGPAPSQSSILEGPGGRVALVSWAMRSDPQDRGLSQHWAGGAFAGRMVTVPMSANPLPVTGPGGMVNYQGSIAWYRTAFRIPRAGAYMLHFESVNHRATVWLDGRPLGTHIGTYLPFEYRISPAPGEHTVVVRADWRDPVEQAREGFHRTWFNFGGINREVSIRPIGPSELQSPSVSTTLLPGGQARVAVSVDVRNNGTARALAPAGSLRVEHGSQSVDLHFALQRVAHGATVTEQATAILSHPSLWQPGSPTLYDLNLTIGSEAGYFAPVGLRQLTWSGGRLYLNGRRLVLHGASLQEDVRGHGDALTPADQDALVSDLQAIGANATRSQHPLDPGLLERLDRAGILVWQGVGPVDPAGDWTANTLPLMNLAQRRVRISVRQAQIHPSVIAWNLANEIAGNGHVGGQQQYIARMAQWLHQNDPGRLVAVDVWGDHPPRVAGPLYRSVDAIGETNYAGWYDGALQPPEAIARTIRDRVGAMARTFAGKVLVISEFGAEANALNKPTRPGGYDFQARLLAQHIAIYDRSPALSGMLVWDLRDFAVAPSFAGGSINRVVPGIRLVKGLNQKGLYTYGAQPKTAVATVASQFARLPAY